MVDIVDSMLNYSALYSGWCGGLNWCMIVYTVHIQLVVSTVHSALFTVLSSLCSVVGEVDSMGLKGAIERLLRRRNADTGQRIEASEERKK